jgi:hypothetical protein
VAIATIDTHRLAVPPGAPWEELRVGGGPHGYSSVYLSDALARYPVRAVTKPHDNKSDPNIETGTYGLFSTCQVKMRASIARKGVPYIFFVTTHGSRPRSLAGYYHVGWVAPGPDQDFALAAREFRFTDPIPATKLTGDARRAVEVRRGYTGVDEVTALELRAAVDQLPDRTDSYRAEVHRLEALSLRATGYRYPTWQRATGWSWADAPIYLAQPAVESSGAVPNRAPDNAWHCQACSRSSFSVARLKRCPHCGALGALQPLEGDD